MDGKVVDMFVKVLNLNYKRQRELEQELEWLQNQAHELEFFLQTDERPEHSGH